MLCKGLHRIWYTGQKGISWKTNLPFKCFHIVFLYGTQTSSSVWTQRLPRCHGLDNLWWEMYQVAFRWEKHRLSSNTCLIKYQWFSADGGSFTFDLFLTQLLFGCSLPLPLPVTSDLLILCLGPCPFWVVIAIESTRGSDFCASLADRPGGAVDGASALSPCVLPTHQALWRTSPSFRLCRLPFTSLDSWWHRCSCLWARSPTDH